MDLTSASTPILIGNGATVASSVISWFLLRVEV
jgi:hypothetical protein